MEGNPAPGKGKGDALGVLPGEDDAVQGGIQQRRVDAEALGFLSLIA